MDFSRAPLPPSTHFLTPIGHCTAPSDFKGSSREKRSTRSMRASWKGDHIPREGWRTSGDSLQRSVSSKKRIQSVSKSWFLSGLPGQIRSYEVPTGRGVRLWLRSQVCRMIPDFWVPAWIWGAGVAIQMSSRLSLSPPWQGGSISPAHKAVCDPQHVYNLKQYSFTRMLLNWAI